MSTKKLQTSRRKLLKGTAATAAIAPFFIGRSAAAAEAEVTIKVATVAPSGTPWAALFKKFASYGRKVTEGRVKFKAFFGGILGPEIETIAACKAGRIGAYGGSFGAIAQGAGIPALEALEIPFALNSRNGQKALAANRQMIHDILWDNGLKLVIFAENGSRCIGSTFPVETPADLKGRKMRSQETKSHLKYWSECGASPVPMGVTEVLSSLQTGIIEGFDNTSIFAFATSWASAITNWCHTEHIYQPACVVISAKVWEKLPDEIKEAMALDSDDVLKMEKRGFRSVQSLAPQLEENFVSMGIEVHKPDLGPWRQKAKGVERDFKSRTTKEGVALLNALKKST